MTMCFYWRESVCVNLKSMCHVCLHLHSDDVYVFLIGCRCAPLQGDWRSCVLIGRKF